MYRSICPFCGNSYEQRFVLYGVQKRNQDNISILVDSHVLRYNNDGSVYRICPQTYNILLDNSVISTSVFHPGFPLLEKDREVSVDDEKYIEEYDQPYYRRYVPIAVAGDCPVHGLYFTVPQQADVDAIAYADSKRASLNFTSDEFGIVAGPKSSDLTKRGINNYLDLFSSRQLLYLWNAIDLMKTMEPTVRLKLALLVSTSTEFNSMLCGYKGAAKSRPGAIRHTFAHHAYSFPYTALENNPVHNSRSSGTLHNLFQSRILRGSKWARKPVERIIKDKRTSLVTLDGEIDAGTEYSDYEDLVTGTHRFVLIQGSSVSLALPDDSVDHIVTDPPYFDSVQYSDLAAFFRVWLKQLVPTEADWDYSLGDSAVNQQATSGDQYKSVLGGIFAECYRVLKKDTGRLIFTFHHWNPQGWKDLTITLKNAGFILVNRYVIHAENPSSVHVVNQNALVHDVVLVLGSSTTGYSLQWSLPKFVDRASSFDFCEQCGTAVGYMLESALDEEEISSLWGNLLK